MERLLIAAVIVQAVKDYVTLSSPKKKRWAKENKSHIKERVEDWESAESFLFSRALGDYIVLGNLEDLITVKRVRRIARKGDKEAISAMVSRWGQEVGSVAE